MYTKEELQEAVSKSFNYSQVIRCLDRSVTGASMVLIKKNITKYEIDIRHFTFKTKNPISTKKIHWSKILVLDNNLSSRRCAYQLRRALIECGILHKCKSCGIDEWCGSKITLEIDHIDGNWKNNLKENLRFLCPNCHSLTPNFYHTKLQKFCKCGRAISKAAKSCHKCSDRTLQGLMRRKVEWPTKEYLTKLIWEKPTTHIAKMYNVTDKAIEKWCKCYRIDKPPRGYWAKEYSKRNATI